MVDKSQGKGGSEHQNEQGRSHMKRPLYIIESGPRDRGRGRWTVG